MTTAALNGLVAKCSCGAEFIVATVKEAQDLNVLCPTCLEDCEDQWEEGWEDEESSGWYEDDDEYASQG